MRYEQIRVQSDSAYALNFKGNPSMTAFIHRPKFERSQEIFSESRWREFLDEVRLYSEAMEQEVRSLRENSEKLLTIINLIPVAFFVKDRKSRFFLMNHACEEQWGMSFAKLRGTDGSQFFPPEQMKQFLATDRSIFEGRKPVEFEETFWSAAKKADRTGYTFKLPMYDASGNPQYLVCVTLDTTERKIAQAALLASEKKLLILATTDPLTELPNRRQFFARLAEEFARVQRLHNQRCSMLMIDLDRFKLINDTYGHAMGDAVLQHFAQLLRNAFRGIDMAARVGGEEFAVILPGSDLAAAGNSAERLREIVAKTPLMHDGKTIPVTVSIGAAAMGPSDSEADQTLIRADEALYGAKKNGRNQVQMAADQAGGRLSAS
jgi:diguanylate cyclase (GGDEF)-like protein/PAS domain S-box-containing protein